MADIISLVRSSKFTCGLLLVLLLVSCKEQGIINVQIDFNQLYRFKSVSNCPDLLIYNSKVLISGTEFDILRKESSLAWEAGFFSCYDKSDIELLRRSKGYYDFISTKDTILVIEDLFPGGRENLVCSSINTYKFKNIILFLISDSRISSSMPKETILLFKSGKFIVGPTLKLAALLVVDGKLVVKHYHDFNKELTMVFDEKEFVFKPISR